MRCNVAMACLAATLVVAASSGLATAQPQYYNYSTTGNGNSYPFNESPGKEVQLLYLPGDFNQPSPAPAGIITSVSFRINDGYPLGPWEYSDFTIKLGQSTITSLDYGAFYTGALTTVYTRTSVTLQAAAGSWLTIPLDTPFAYNPAQSLIVDVGQCGASGAWGFSACFTQLSGLRRVWSNGGCPFTPYPITDAFVYHFGVTLTTGTPPSVTTTAATSVGLTAATLNGTVNPNGFATTVTFEYGETASYGSTVTADQSPVSGTSDTPVSATLSGLDPGTVYHYRVVGTSVAGTTDGEDATFQTEHATAVPTLTGSGLIALAALFGVLSLSWLRRRIS